MANKNLNNDGIANNGNENNEVKNKVRVGIHPNFLKYIVYSNGRVFNREMETWLNEAPNKQKSKYLSLSIRDNNNNRQTISLHRLVWETFNGEIPEDKQINHIDENTHNNDISNLELVTPVENCNHGTRNKRISSTSKGRKKPKQTFKVMVNGEKEEQYKSITELCKAHPTQNRMTWRYRLYIKDNPQRSYFTYEDGTLLQITPMNAEYVARVEEAEEKKENA